MSLERKFSFIYSEIVEDENDMIGHIAYSLYKSSKIKYIEQFKIENGGNNPSEMDLNAFHMSARTTIPALKIQAEQVLSNFTQFALEETVSEIEKEIKTTQENILKDIINPIIPPKPKGPWDGFWMAVLVKGTQAIVVAIILFLVIFGASAKEDFWGTIRKLLPESNKLENSNNPRLPKDST
jgi:predicted PurR-regulated permease PerM